MAGAPITLYSANTVTTTTVRNKGVTFPLFPQGCWQSGTYFVDVAAIVATETWTIDVRWFPVGAVRFAVIGTIDLTDADVGTIKAIPFAAPFDADYAAIPSATAISYTRTLGAGNITTSIYFVPGD